MATIVQNQNATLTVTLTDLEKITYAGLAVDELQNFITIWLGDKSKTVFQNSFNSLSPEQQAEILAYFAPPAP